jgi:hypothetical protein
MASAAAEGFHTRPQEASVQSWNFVSTVRALLGTAAAVVTIVAGWNQMFPPDPETVFVEVPTPVPVAPDPEIAPEDTSRQWY